MMLQYENNTHIADLRVMPFVSLLSSKFIIIDIRAFNHLALKQRTQNTPYKLTTYLAANRTTNTFHK